jgi:hypothetical protein
MHLRVRSVPTSLVGRGVGGMKERVALVAKAKGLQLVE